MTASVAVLLAALLGLVVGLLFGDPMPGVAFGLGLLLGAIGSILLVPALRAAPAGLSGAAIDDAAAGWAEFHRELARARRFDGQFAIVCFSVDGPRDADALAGVRNEIAASSRRIDRLWIDEDHILLLLPHATQAAAEVVLDRIRAQVPIALAVEPGLAMFPEHGITSGALISAVYGNGQEDVPTPIAAIRPEFRPQPASEIAIVADEDAATPAGEMASQSG
jgi:hypothetical protein